MSISELRAAFEVAHQHLGAAGHHARNAQDTLADAAEMLTELSEDHSGCLLPPELARATDILERVLIALAESAETVERFSSAL